MVVDIRDGSQENRTYNSATTDIQLKRRGKGGAITRLLD